MNPALDVIETMEADTAQWRAFLEENFDALIEGMPKRPEGWWKELPECPVLAMFEIFPLVKLQ